MLCSIVLIRTIATAKTGRNVYTFITGEMLALAVLVGRQLQVYTIKGSRSAVTSFGVKLEVILQCSCL